MPKGIYPIKLKEAIVKKYLNNTEGLGKFSALHGIPESSLRGWIREAETGILGDMNKPKHTKYLTPEEKFTALLKFKEIETEKEKGVWLRRHGIKMDHIDKWETEIKETLSRPKVTNTEKLKIKSLEKDLSRKEKALAEVVALLVLKKKAEAIWGTEDEEA